MTYTDAELDALLKLAEEVPSDGTVIQLWKNPDKWIRFIAASREAIPRLVEDLRETRKSFAECLNERASLRSQLADLDAMRLRWNAEMAAQLAEAQEDNGTTQWRAERYEYLLANSGEDCYQLERELAEAKEELKKCRAANYDYWKRAAE